MIIGWLGKFCRKFYMRYEELTIGHWTQLTKPGVLFTATISRYILKLRNDEMASCLQKLGIELLVFINPKRYYILVVQCMDKAQYCVSSNLTHWDQDNLTAILQTTFSNSFLLYGNCILLFKLAVIQSKWVNQPYASIGPLAPNCHYIRCRCSGAWWGVSVSNCHALLTTPQFNCIFANNG